MAVAVAMAVMVLLVLVAVEVIVAVVSAYRRQYGINEKCIKIEQTGCDGGDYGSGDGIFGISGRSSNDDGVVVVLVAVAAILAIFIVLWIIYALSGNSTATSVGQKPSLERVMLPTTS